MKSKVKRAWKLLISSPNYLKIGIGFRMRNLLRGRKNIDCVVRSVNNTFFFLGEDRIDEVILHHLFVDFHDLYFPIDLKFSSQDLVMDVGTHHAVYLSELLKRNEGINAIAIEPDITSLRYISRNLSLNNLQDRVEVINAAVSDIDGTSYLIRSNEGSWGNLISQTPDRNKESETIKLISLNSLIENSRFRESILSNKRKFKLLKINAEGGEFSILPLIFGARIYPEYIILMVHPEHGSWEQLSTLIFSNGYEIKVAHNHPTRPAYHCVRKQ